MRQFDKGSGRTAYEVSGFGRVQTVEVQKQSATQYDVTIYGSGITTSTENPQTYTQTSPPTFEADGGTGDDKLSFLGGEEYVDDAAGELELSSHAVLDPDHRPHRRLRSRRPHHRCRRRQRHRRRSRRRTPSTPASATTGPPAEPTTTRSPAAPAATTCGAAPATTASRAGRAPTGSNGEDGNDSLVGGAGRDVRSLLVQPRGTTDDVIADQVRLGFDSGDVVVGGTGVDSVDGGDGSDVVVGGTAPTLTGATLGSLFTTGTRTVNVLTQGATTSDASVIGTRAVATDTAKVPGDAQLDALCVSGTPASGTTDQDFVTGGAEKDVVVGGDGPDTLDGGAGPDEICGRAGDDQISGDAGSIGTPTDGSADADVIRGGTGDDRVDAGPGDDLVFGDDVDLVRDGVRVLDGSLGTAVDRQRPGLPRRRGRRRRARRGWRRGPAARLDRRRHRLRRGPRHRGGGRPGTAGLPAAALVQLGHPRGEGPGRPRRRPARRTRRATGSPPTPAGSRGSTWSTDRSWPRARSPSRGCSAAR